MGRGIQKSHFYFIFNNPCRAKKTEYFILFIQKSTKKSLPFLASALPGSIGGKNMVFSHNKVCPNKNIQ
jgi:hypothetical protein